tara:strand:- start:511 stop:1176 length:666 start_codon:yes stop_codon:yes gene_type:complete
MMRQLTDKIKKVFLYLSLLFFLSTISNLNILNSLKEFFNIEEIKIKNIAYEKEFIHILGKNIFKIKKTDIEKILIKFPNIEKFRVNKIYPDKLSISLFETKLLAKIVKNNNLYIIGSNGNMFLGEGSYDLPLIEGTQSIDKINLILKNIYSNNINLELINKLIFYESDRWDIIFKDKTTLRLPNLQFLKVMKKAKILIEREEFKSKIIDLRIKNKVIVSNE